MLAAPGMIVSPTMINGRIRGGNIGTGAITQNASAHGEGGSFKLDVPIPIPVLLI